MNLLRSVAASCCALALLCAQTSRPTAQSTAETKAAPLTERAIKKKKSNQAQELRSGYTTWLTVDVGYIITPEERAAFLKLNNDEEREQFIEAFWERRDPTPDTEENERKEEHYRRFAYANEHFSSGIPGWKTDRGHVYILHGAPDEREEHSSGGFYSRTPNEGGGETSTFPFERWRYRHLDGVGENIELEFVDPTMSGEFHLTIDPSEKDALLHVPNAGLTDSERFGYSTKADRFRGTDGTNIGPTLYGQSQSQNQFTRMETMFNALKPPPLGPRETAFIGTSIRYNVLPLAARVDYFPVTAASVFTYITLQFENRDLQFVSREGMQRATVHIEASLSTMTHKRVATFEDTLSVDSPADLLGAMMQRKSVYSKRLALSPGSYRLTVIAKDTVAGNIGLHEEGITVPAVGQDRLAISSVILADSIEPLPMKSIGAGQFAIGDLKVRPRVDATFHPGERIGIYFKLYNFDSEAGAPRGTAEAREIVCEVTHNGESVARQTSEAAATAETSIQKWLDLKDFAPGAYSLRVQVTDKSTGKNVSRTVPFSVR
jgi:GWxTD domain-containing protein